MKKTALALLLISFLIPPFLKFSVQSIFATSGCGFGDIQNFTATVNGNQITFVVKDAPPTSNNRELYILIVDPNVSTGAKSTIKIFIDKNGSGAVTGSTDTKGSYIAQIFPIPNPHDILIDPCSIAIQFSVTTGVAPSQTEQIKTTSPQAESGPTKYLGPADVNCTPYENVSPERNPRPAQCNICNVTELLTPSCATSFSVFDKITYSKMESEIIEKSWSGDVTVDPTQVKIPFVGKRNMEPETRWERLNPLDTPDENAKRWYQFWEIPNADENKYLADYLEGTNEYYRNYGNQTTITNYQGVLRKLTPFEYQNQLKRNLVSRVGSGEENQIHDYTIKYIGRFCWDVPFWMEAGKFVLKNLTQLAMDNTINKIFAFFSNLFNFENTPRLEFDPPDIGHYCLYASPGDSGPVGWFVAQTDNFMSEAPVVGPIYNKLFELSEIPGLVHLRHGKTLDENSLSDLAQHFPPNPNEEKYKDNHLQYTKDFLEWKEEDDGQWYRLWQVTPMLSREDTQGEIDPYLADEHPDDWFELEEESEEVEKTKIEAVPHLARLYEGSQIIHQILTPEGKEIEMFKSESIAKTTPPNACFVENYLPTDENGDGLCLEKITGELVAWEEFPNPYYEKCHQELNSLERECASLSLSSPSIDTITNCYDQLNALKEECQEEVVEGVSRAFGINLYHPYLDEIWSYSTYANSAGFFNIFRPHEQEQFEDIAAADTISYDYNTSGDASPTEGLFLFPHLGGVQEAKKWTVNQALWPYEKSK